MNNNLGPQEGQNLNPVGTNVQVGVEPVSQPVGGAPVPPVPPAPPIESLTPEAPAAPVSPMPTPTIAPIQPLPGAAPIPTQSQVNVEPLPSITPTPSPTPAPVVPPVTPVGNLGSLGGPQAPEIAPSPVAPVAPVVPVSPVGGEPLPSTTPVEPGPVGDTIVPPVDDKPKGNKNLIFAIVGLVLVLAVAGGGLFAMKFLGNKDKTNNDDNEVSNVATTSKVNFNGYTFEIPETMYYNVNGNLLTLTSKDNKWATAIGVLAGTYNTLKENRATIQTNFQGKGYTASDGDVKTYEGIEYLTYELTAAKTNVLAAYTRLSDNVVLYLSAASVSNQFDYEILEEITPIVSTAKENSASFGMELPEDNDVSNVLDNITENATEN